MNKFADDSSSDIVEVTADGAVVAPKTNLSTHAEPFAPAASESRPSYATGTVEVTAGKEMNHNFDKEHGRPESEKGRPDDGMTEPEEPSRVKILQTQTQAIADLRSKVLLLRSIPAHLIILHQQSPLISFDLDTLLNTDAATSGTMKSHDMGSQAKSAFRMISEARDEILKGTVQIALKSAQQSQQDDKTGLLALCRRSRKKQHTEASDSPITFSGFEHQKRTAFPTSSSQPEVRTFDDLVEFVKQRNAQRDAMDTRNPPSKTTLRIWFRSRPSRDSHPCVSDPLSVRARIRDVVDIFIKLRHPFGKSGDGQLIVESAVALGPREKKTASSHSDFIVYQKLSQQLLRMIEQDPKVTIAQFMELVRSYEGLFVMPCSVCSRVLSQDKHIPPVARIWTGGSSTGDVGRWEARHVSCLQN